MDIEEVKEMLNSLSLSDVEKKDQLNMLMLHAHIKWMEEHIKWLEKRIENLEEYREEKQSREVSYATIVNTPKRARIFDYLLKNEVAEGKEIAAYVGSDPNYISHTLNKWVREGILISPSRGSFKLPVDDRVKALIANLVDEITLRWRV